MVDEARNTHNAISGGNFRLSELPRPVHSGGMRRLRSDPRAWIDVSVPLRHGMVCWPGDREVCIEQVLDMARGDACNLTHLAMSAHAGTHMDAPRHFVAEGAPLDAWTPEATIGPARVVWIEERQCIKPEQIEAVKPRRGERLLLKTPNSARCWSATAFVADYVYIRQDAAHLLAARGVRTVGIDYLSVGGFPVDAVETHQALLGAGVWIIEGLNLSMITPGLYDLLCLPLRLAGADGAPARALLRPRRA